MHKLAVNSHCSTTDHLPLNHVVPVTTTSEASPWRAKFKKNRPISKAHRFMLEHHIQNRTKNNKNCLLYIRGFALESANIV